MSLRCAETDLVSAASEILEMMFFTGVMGDGEEISAEEASKVAVKVEFHGSSSGQFHMALPTQTAEQLAANFLGLPPDQVPTDQQVTEVINELGNMVCGAFLSRHESEQIFDLSTPEQEQIGTDALRSCTVHRSLDLDNGSLVLALQWDRLASKN